jgi:Resolvase, N terminal domain
MPHGRLGASTLSWRRSQTVGTMDERIRLAEVKLMAGKGKRKIEAFGYMRTSSATNVGRDKDSEVRQRAAIESYAKAAGYSIVDWFYDPAVKGSDAVTERPGFKNSSTASPATASAPSLSRAPTDLPATSLCSSPAMTSCETSASHSSQRRHRISSPKTRRPPCSSVRCWERSHSSRRPRSSRNSKLHEIAGSRLASSAAGGRATPNSAPTSSRRRRHYRPSGHG